MSFSPDGVIVYWQVISERVLEFCSFRRAYWKSCQENNKKPLHNANRIKLKTFDVFSCYETASSFISCQEAPGPYSTGFCHMLQEALGFYRRGGYSPGVAIPQVCPG